MLSAYVMTVRCSGRFLADLASHFGGRGTRAENHGLPRLDQLDGRARDADFLLVEHALPYAEWVLGSSGKWTNSPAMRPDQGASGGERVQIGAGRDAGDAETA